CERAAPLAARRQRGALGSALPLARDQGGELLQRPGLRRVPEGLEPLAEDGATAARSSLDLRGPRLPTEEGHVPLVRVAWIRPAAQGSLWPTARGEHLPRAIELGTGMKRPEWGREDSNLRRLSRRVYSPFPLAARAHPRGGADCTRLKVTPPAADAALRH